MGGAAGRQGALSDKERETGTSGRGGRRERECFRFAVKAGKRLRQSLGWLRGTEVGSRGVKKRRLELQLLSSSGW